MRLVLHIAVCMQSDSTENKSKKKNKIRSRLRFRKSRIWKFIIEKIQKILTCHRAMTLSYNVEK